MTIDKSRFLLLLRVTVFFVMAIWTIDKFINPDHAATVFQNFYYIDKEMTRKTMAVLGAMEALILTGFLMGLKKRITYGIVLLLHGISTLSSWQQYLSPFKEQNLLFFAAWPMLAACITLYLLRDRDILSVAMKR